MCGRRLERHGNARADGLADERLRCSVSVGAHRQLDRGKGHEPRGAHSVRRDDAPRVTAPVGRRLRVRLPADVAQRDARPRDRLARGCASLDTHGGEQAQRRTPGQIEPHVGQVDVHEVVARRHQGASRNAAAVVEGDRLH